MIRKGSHEFRIVVMLEEGRVVDRPDILAYVVNVNVDRALELALEIPFLVGFRCEQWLGRVLGRFEIVLP